MPGMSGLELQAELNHEQCRIPTIFITAHGDEKMRMQALSRRGGVPGKTIRRRSLAQECSGGPGKLSPISSV